MGRSALLIVVATMISLVSLLWLTLSITCWRAVLPPRSRSTFEGNRVDPLRACMIVKTLFCIVTILRKKLQREAGGPHGQWNSLFYRQRRVIIGWLRHYRGQRYAAPASQGPKAQLIYRVIEDRTLVQFRRAFLCFDFGEVQHCLKPPRWSGSRSLSIHIKYKS